MTKTLITGGLGFIGSHITRAMLDLGHDVLVVDAETYAADRRRLEGLSGRSELVLMDINDDGFHVAVEEFGPDLILHLAAETHVTRGESSTESFFRANHQGTRSVLEAARRLDEVLVVHFSTDEVYGSTTGAPFMERDKRPGEGDASSAYARSKALADDLALEWATQLPVIVLRPANCYGPWQHPEKAIPRWVIRALRSERLPVWGTGEHVRDWMFVSDLVEAVKRVIDRGTPGEVYNVAPQGGDIDNLAIASQIASIANDPAVAVYRTSYDRPEHDLRYAIDASKIRRLGWTPSVDLERGLKRTFEWYASNGDWWQDLWESAEEIYDDAQPATD